jgi:hypothetical protein
MLIDKLVGDKRLTGNDFRVVLWIAQHSFGQWKRTGPGKRDGVRPEWTETTGYRIAKETGMDRRSVGRSIARMVEIGVLQRRSEDGALGIDEHYESGALGPLSEQGKSGALGPLKAGHADPYSEKGIGASRPLKRGTGTPTIGASRPLKRGTGTPIEPRKGQAGRALRDPGEGRVRESGEKERARRAPKDVPGFARIGPRKRTRKDPWRRVEPDRRKELETLVSSLITWFTVQTRFDAGQWWGRGVKLGRWAPAMHDALLQLSRRIAALETTYKEKEANLNADAATAESRKRQKEAGPGREDKVLI